MSFELRDHTADVAVAASAPTRDALFAAVGDGLAAAGCDEIPPTGGDRFDVEVRAESVEALLFDYLDQLIYERDVRGVLPVDNEVRVVDGDGTGSEGGDGGSDDDGNEDDRNRSESDDDRSDSDGDGSEGDDGSERDAEWTLSGSARGVPLDAVDAREIKAVTYSEMRVEETAEGWEAYVVLDV